MKTRTNFVSNSSSSSFIIACDKKLEGKLTLEIEFDLTNHKEITLENLDRWLDEYFYSSYEELEEDEKQRYNKLKQQCLRELKKGNQIFYGDVSNEDSDNPIGIQILDNGGFKGLIKTKQVKIIQDARL